MTYAKMAIAIRNGHKNNKWLENKPIFSNLKPSKYSRLVFLVCECTYHLATLVNSQLWSPSIFFVGVD
jgi:hypothetical protein